MATTAKRLIPGSLLTNAAVAYYTAPANTKGVIKAMALTNTSAGVVKVTVYLVPNGSAADATHTVISGLSLTAGQTYNCPEAINQVIEAAGQIFAKDDTGGVTSIVASGLEVV